MISAVLAGALSWWKRHVLDMCGIFWLNVNLSHQNLQVVFFAQKNQPVPIEETHPFANVHLLKA